MRIFKQNLALQPSKVLIDEVSGVWYHGEAYSLAATTAQAVWRIKRITLPGTVEYADGNVNFDNVWDDRTTLSYS